MGGVIKAPAIYWSYVWITWCVKESTVQKLETQHTVDLVNLLVSESFLPSVDKKGLTSVNFNLKYREINCTDFCAALLTQSSGMIQTWGDACTVNAIMTNCCSLLAVKIMIICCVSILITVTCKCIIFKFCNKVGAYFISLMVGNINVLCSSTDAFIY